MSEQTYEERRRKNISEARLMVPRLVKRMTWSREQIEDAFSRCDGEIDRMVDLLEVSKRGLRSRMNKLGLGQ